MDGPTFGLAIAPYVVGALGIGVAGIWGRTALAAKNEVLKVKDQVISAKDDQLKAIVAAKDEQIKTVEKALAETIRLRDTHIAMLEQFRPTSLLEQLGAFISWNEQLASQLVKSRGEVEVSAAAAKAGSEERDKLQHEVERLTGGLEEAEKRRQAAEQLASSLSAMSTLVAKGNVAATGDADYVGWGNIARSLLITSALRTPPRLPKSDTKKTTVPEALKPLAPDAGPAQAPESDKT